MKAGVIQQIGKPDEIYNHPENTFVAGFIGSPAMNFMDGKVIKGDGGLWVSGDGYKIKVPADHESKLKNYIDKSIVFGIRPEDLYDKIFSKNSTPENTVDGVVDVVEPLGSETQLHITIGKSIVVAKVNPRTEAKDGQKIDVVFDLSNMHAFDRETQKRIL